MEEGAHSASDDPAAHGLIARFPLIGIHESRRHPDETNVLEGPRRDLRGGDLGLWLFNT
jgi:hypothetical protein